MLSAGALHQAEVEVGGLIVDERQMRKNLDLTSGLIVAEAVMMGLAPHLGRQQAHDVVYAACRRVSEQGGRLADVLAAEPEVARHLDRAAIERLTDPANYLGAAPADGRPHAGRPAEGREFSSGGRRPTATATVAGVQISKPGDHRC